MKMLTAVIRPEKLDDVMEGLKKAGCPGVMIEEIRGQGRQGGIELEWRVGSYRVEFLPKDRLQIVVEDSMVDQIVETIITCGTTGEVGDGKIFITPVEEVVRIRTGERGSIAV